MGLAENRERPAFFWKLETRNWQLKTPVAAKLTFAIAIAIAIATTYANGQLKQRVLQRQPNPESPQYTVSRPNDSQDSQNPSANLMNLANLSHIFLELITKNQERITNNQ